jgi:hypothetical protein
MIGCNVALTLLTIIDAIYQGSTNRPALSMGVFFIFVFITFFGWGLDAPSYVYCSEIFPTHIRSIGTSFSLIGAFLSSLVYVQAAPTALASIGWKYYLIFIIITFLSTFLFAFVFPETKGRSLEELNAEFGDEVAVDYSESSKVDFTQLRETMLHNFNVYLTSDSAVPEESPAQEPTGETDSKQVVA